MTATSTKPTLAQRLRKNHWDAYPEMREAADALDAAELALVNLYHEFVVTVPALYTADAQRVLTQARDALAKLRGEKVSGDE